MGVRAIGLQSLLSIPVLDNRPKTRAEVRLEELRGVSPLEFAKRGVVERPLRGASALRIQLTPTHSGSLGGGLHGMAEEIVQAQSRAKTTIVGMEPLSELLRVGRR
jgi:hypothetical protein